MKFRLKDFRQAHKMFQSDLAELLDSNQSTISRMELVGACKLTYPQVQALYGKFGREDVDAFWEEEITVEVNGNTNEGEGTQNNGYFGADTISLGIIKQQSEALIKLSAKQAEQTDKLIELLQKVNEKL